MATLTRSISEGGLEFQKTRFEPGQIHLTGTTFRTRRQKSVDQQTLRIENVPGRAPRDKPAPETVHPPGKKSTPYKVNNPPPNRVYGEVVRTKYGGEQSVQDQFQTWWERGEHWNRDSNIRRWTFQETRRNAAHAAHDVHRHDQVNGEKLPGDRESNIEIFKTWIPPRHTDKYDPKKSGATLACGVHHQCNKANTEFGWCYDGEMVRPTAIYTKKFQKMGEEAFRKRGTWVI